MHYAKPKSIIASTVIASLALSTLGIGAASAAENANSSGTSLVESAAKTPSGEISNAQFEHTISVLEKLPSDIKNANPKTTPNYEQRLNEAINKIEGSKNISSRGNSTTYVNWLSCGASLAGVVVQYGVPVGKVLGWLKEGYKIYGGVKGLISAIRTGAAIAEIGEEGAKVLEGILGIDGVVKACS